MFWQSVCSTICPNQSRDMVERSDQYMPIVQQNTGLRGSASFHTFPPRVCTWSSTLFSECYQKDLNGVFTRWLLHTHQPRGIRITRTFQISSSTKICRICMIYSVRLSVWNLPHLDLSDRYVRVRSRPTRAFPQYIISVSILSKLSRSYSV